VLRKALEQILILIASATLLPTAAVAFEESRSIRIGHLGEKAEATVELSSTDGGMSAIPFLKFSADPEDIAGMAGTDIESVKKLLANVLPVGNKIAESLREPGDISFSRGSRLFKDLKTAVKARKNRTPSFPRHVVTDERLEEKIREPFRAMEHLHR
jgi:hypothetical protein